MAEQPKQSDIATEPKLFSEVLDELFGNPVDKTFTPPDSQAEAARKQAANLTDATNHVRNASEDRADLIDRQKDGEAIDPSVLQHSGQLLIEAHQRAQQALVEQGDTKQGITS